MISSLAAAFLLAAAVAAPATTRPCPKVKVACSDRITAKTCDVLRSEAEKQYARWVDGSPTPRRMCDLFPDAKEVQINLESEGVEVVAPLVASTVAELQLDSLKLAYVPSGGENKWVSIEGPNEGLQAAWRIGQAFSRGVVGFSKTTLEAAVVLWGLQEPRPRVTIELVRGDTKIVLDTARTWTTGILSSASVGRRYAFGSDQAFEEVFRSAVAKARGRGAPKTH